MNSWKLVNAFILFVFLIGSGAHPVSSKAQNIKAVPDVAQIDDGDIYIPIVQRPVPPPPTHEWGTVAANPQRTSWNTEQVGGNLQVAWYMPIEAYIPQNVQLIAANGMIYVATSRGLYALNAENGSVIWRFDTEMPIGNSPTVLDGVVYVAGYDRKVRALNASTGAQIWEFAGAKAGYDTNPLVVEGKVFLGNRDGNLYALNSANGHLLWQFPTGGPISISAAYNNGVVYFASNDHYAYAVNTNGTLKWKSAAKLPGDGIQSYWPVVVKHPVTGEDLVVYALSSLYRFDMTPGTRSIICDNGDPCDNSRFYNEDLFYDKPSSGDTPLSGPVQVNEPWAAGKTVLNYSRMTEFLENSPQPNAHLHKPWRRLYAVLNGSNGSEYTFDSDNDGYGEYAPIIPFSTSSGTGYPPVYAPDGLLRFSNLWLRNGQGRVMGWRVGTKYLTLEGAQGDTAEPQAISAGGNYLYRSICCDRVGDWYNMTNLGDTGFAWHYIRPLDDSAPGYDQMWWFLSDELERLYGNYGGVNGIYHNHGDQNPIIPYAGRLYIHRSNAVIAFGTNRTSGQRPLLNDATVSQTMVTPSTQELSDRLSAEVSKIIAAGHLKPGFYSAGQFNIYHEFNDYFDNPGYTLYTLASAYPYVSANVQTQLKTYLQSEFNSYFDPVMYSHIGWVDGAAREAVEYPPEITADFANYPKQQGAGPFWSWSYPQYNFYGMWKYALIFQSDPTYVGHIYDLAKSKLQVPVPQSATTARFQQNPWELNGYVAGYAGFLNLQDLAGRSGADGGLRTQVSNEMNRLKQLRASIFTKDTYYNTFSKGVSFRTLNVARNFIMLVPEMGDYLNQNALAKVQAAVTEYNNVGPYWFVSRYTGSIGESSMQNLYDYHGMFLAKAYILKEPRAQLSKYLDAPAFERGDLFYLQNLIAAIQAP